MSDIKAGDRVRRVRNCPLWACGDAAHRVGFEAVASGVNGNTLRLESGDQVDTANYERVEPSPALYSEPEYTQHVLSAIADGMKHPGHEALIRYNDDLQRSLRKRNETISDLQEEARAARAESVDPYTALRVLQKQVGEANAANGWHERTRELQGLIAATPSVPVNEGRVADALLDHWVATLALIDTEVSEAIEELRNGRSVDETYYLYEDGETQVEYDNGRDPSRTPLDKPRKPEGVPSELADVVIRALDFASRAGIDLAAIVEEKLAYNATRGIRHGGKKL